jgi:hypothetical protein
MCPHCRQNAPIIYRGVFAYCSACNAPRAPFSGKALNLAGQPSKVGGTVASVFGWIVLVIGLAVGLGLMLMLQLLIPSAVIGYALGGFISVVTLAVGLLLLFGGSKLKTSGDQAQREAQMEAVYALAVNRGGAVTALDVGRSLNMAMQQADTLLTAMTKTYPEHVSVEVDENGSLYYQFVGKHGRPFGMKFRVAEDGRVQQQNELEAGEEQQAAWERAQSEAEKRGRS